MNLIKSTNTTTLASIFRLKSMKLEEQPDLFKEQAVDFLGMRNNVESDYENIPLRTRLMSPPSSKISVKATVTNDPVYFSANKYATSDDYYNRNELFDDNRFSTLPRRLATDGASNGGVIGSSLITKQRKYSADFSSNYSLASIINGNNRSSSVLSINNNTAASISIVGQQHQLMRQSNSSLPTSPISRMSAGGYAKTSISSITPLLGNYAAVGTSTGVVTTPGSGHRGNHIRSRFTLSPPSTLLTNACASIDNNYLGDSGIGGSSLSSGTQMTDLPFGDAYSDLATLQELNNCIKNNNQSGSGRSSVGVDDVDDEANESRAAIVASQLLNPQFWLNRNLLLKRLSNTNSKFNY